MTKNIDFKETPIYTLSNARQDLPKYATHSNKSDHGRVLIIAGSHQYPGAGILSASAASRVGVGFVTLSNFDHCYNHWLETPEFLVQSLLKMDRKTMRQFTAIAVGPGLGVTLKLKEFLEKLRDWKIKNVVLDADALNACAKYQIQGPFPASWILTPHEKELSRMLSVEVSQIRKRRSFYALKAAKKWGCLCLLKGEGTLVVKGQKVSQISSGNAALSKAGSGDVLTGMIVGLLAQFKPNEKSSLKAALLGAFLQGLLADQWVQSGRDMISMMTSDLRADLPFLIQKMRSPH